MANYYVIGNTAIPPILTGTPYEGYKIVTEDQISSFSSASPNLMANGDTVVISGSVNTDVLLQPSNGQVDGFDINVKILDNTNTFNISVGNRTGGIINNTEPDVTIDVIGNAANVSIGGNNNMEKLTVNITDGHKIGNITGSTESNDQLIVNGGTNVTVGTITSNNGSDLGDSVTLGAGSKVGAISLGGGDNVVSLGDNTTAGNISTGSGADTISVGVGAKTGNIATGSGNDAVSTGTGSTIGDVDTGDGNDTTTIGGKAGYIQGSGGNDTITVNGTATGIEGNTGDDVINVNGSLVQADGTAGSIYGGNGSDAIHLGDGAKVGGISFGFGGDNGDTLTGGNNVKIDGNITQAISDHYSTTTLGDGTTVTGNINLYGGKDTLSIGDNSSIGGHITTGEDGSADDADFLKIGAGSIVEEYINTNIGDDTLYIGDRTTLNGGTNAINTEIGEDVLYLGKDIVTQPGNPIFTGQGWDTVYAAGGGSYTVDMGIVAPDGDRVTVSYHNAEGKAALEKALADQGFVAGSDGVYTNPDSSNATFVYEGVTYTKVWQVNGIPCFARGTLIVTDRGEVAVEHLAVDDLVLTADHGYRPIRWIGGRALSREVLDQNESLRPIRIQTGALGAGAPTADLVVSPQHRILVRSKIAQKMFGTDEILVAAKQLCQIDGIDVASDIDEVEYFHILFDQHEVVTSNGALTESLYTGAEALKSVGAAARAEIFAIFPELMQESYQPVAARQLSSGRMGRKLVVRHVQNNKPLFG